MKALIEKIKAYHSRKLPFVVYSLPESDTLTALFQKNDQKHTTDDFSDKGFVFAPFVADEILLIPEAECEIGSVKIPAFVEESRYIPLEEDVDEKSNFKHMIQQALDQIIQGNASKIVLSRRKEVKLKQFDYAQLVKRLFGLDATAFRYICYHPSSGFWCGATPEILMKTNGNEFSTMALAGTQKYEGNGNPVWTPKEINEQRWVSEAVVEKLEPASSVLKVSKTKNHRAGSLLHLRTDFNGILKKGKNNFAILARSLHPTPAVCGTPEVVARDFILNNENYDREYYTRYLGPVDIKTKSSHLFVNLRCMKIGKASAYLYVGGGITQFSIPKAEWQETQHKLQTMLQVLTPML